MVLERKIRFGNMEKEGKSWEAQHSKEKDIRNLEKLYKVENHLFVYFRVGWLMESTDK